MSAPRPPFDAAPVADQVAFACRVSPSEGSRRLNTARDLRLDLPRTLTLLASGDIHDYTAQLIVAELRPLSRELRHRVDAELEQAGMAAMPPREAQALARKLVGRADPEAAVRRARTARSDRRVTCRPAPDTMAILSGLLPVEHGVACFAALKAHTDRLIAGGDPRTRGQLMADTLVQRLTGHTSAAAVPVEVQIVIPVEALLDEHSAEPAEVPGYGPLPAELVHELLDRAEGQSWWRRIFTAPTPAGGRTVVEVDRRRHRFPGRSARRFARHAARIIQARDRCRRDPYCTAPIRHLDDIVRYAEAANPCGNGRGVCERGNYVREMPGWTIELIDDHPHTTITTTPTGHSYLSRAPNPP